MSDLKDKLTLEVMTQDSGQPPVDGHDAWVSAQVRERLKAKEDGLLSFKLFHEVAAKFGFNAR